MAKKGSSSTSNASKQNLRQRKKQEGGTKSDNKKNNKSKNTDEEYDEDELLGSGSKKRTGMIPYILAGGLIVLLVALAAGPLSSESEQQQQQKTPKSQQDTSNSREQRELNEEQNQDGGGNTIAQFVKEYKVLKRLPHDTKSFTQGLTFRPDNSSILYESTGMYNESVVRILDLNNNGEVLKQYDTPGQYFGEGLAYFRDENLTKNEQEDEDDDDDNIGRTIDNNKGNMIHITWKERTGFIMDLDTLEVLEEFSYTTTTTEGWGIIHVPDTNEFIVSDGSEYLHFWDMNYKETKPKIRVTYYTQEMADHGVHVSPKPVRLLNELEWDPTTKTVLANVWYQNVILRIDPTTGHVLTIYDLSTLYTDRLPTSDVFNGIALSSNGDLWVTGKYWPYLYQIELGDEPS